MPDLLRIVEFGAGTGRLTRVMAAEAFTVTGFDASAAMIETARRRMAGLGVDNCALSVADSRRVPVPTGAADLSIAGWSQSCLAVYTGERWPEELQEGHRVMRRVVRAGGRVFHRDTRGYRPSRMHGHMVGRRAGAGELRRCGPHGPRRRRPARRGTG